MKDDRADPQFSEQARRIIPGIYEHYRGERYRVISLAHHSETLEELVVYQALYGSYLIWVRPVSIFASKTEMNGTFIDRFRYLSIA